MARFEILRGTLELPSGAKVYGVIETTDAALVKELTAEADRSGAYVRKLTRAEEGARGGIVLPGGAAGVAEAEEDDAEDQAPPKPAAKAPAKPAGK